MTPTHDLLVLDPSIRDWVVIPLLLIIAISGLVRPALQAVLKGVAPPPTESEILAFDAEARARHVVARAHRTRIVGGHGILCEDAYVGRKTYYIGGGGAAGTEGGGKGLLLSADISAPPAPSDPMAMMMGGGAMSGMKGQAAFMIQNMVMMNGIQHFFQGFVLLKIPFPLTNGFKPMFHRGLNLTTLDTSYVSSLSWYFVVSFGLRGFYRLYMSGWGREYVSDGMFKSLQMGIGQGGGPQFNAGQLYKMEADNFEMTRFRPLVDDAEKKLLGKKYPQKISLSAGTCAGKEEGELYAISGKKTKASSKQGAQKKNE